MTRPMTRPDKSSVTRPVMSPVMLSMKSSISIGTQTRVNFPRLSTLLLAGATALLVPVTQAQQAPAANPAVHTAPAKATPTRASATAQKPHDEPDGEQVFAANCSRCHTAPDGFSQRISGTVVRHMRVRASLSEADEKALMRFFNPQ